MFDGRGKTWACSTQTTSAYAAETGRCEHIAPNPAGVNSRAGCINASGDFVPRHNGHPRKVRIKSEAARDVWRN